MKASGNIEVRFSFIKEWLLSSRVSPQPVVPLPTPISVIHDGAARSLKRTGRLGRIFAESRISGNDPFAVIVKRS